MAEEHHKKSHDYEAKVGDEVHAVETQDRGLFDLMGKKEEAKPQEEVIATEFEKVKVSEPEHHVVAEEGKHKDEEKKPSLLEKLRRSDSSSSSVSTQLFTWKSYFNMCHPFELILMIVQSDEEEDEEKKKKKKEKKGLKEKVQEKISGEKDHEHEDTSVPVEKYEEAEAGHPEEKKGFLDKIKDKLPGQHKKAEEVEVPPPPPPAAAEHGTATEASPHDAEAKEKKGFLDKIKEKLPGYHPKTDEDKEKEKESATH